MSNEANSNLQNDGFQKVSYKNKFRKSKPKIPVRNHPSIRLDLDQGASTRRILNAKSELSTADLFDSIRALLKEGLSALNNPKISEIVCFGLGKIGECLIARYQFALLLCLKELYNVDVHAYDPIFNENDIKLLEYFEIKILKKNLEGKYKVREKKITLFYLPHCPKQLSNNLLWANWGLNLNYCIIVANSFNTILESCTKKTLVESAEYISKITPYVLELSVINSFKYYEVFNDTSIHFFPKLNLIAPYLWESCTEPKYLDEDVEFVRNNLNHLLI